MCQCLTLLFYVVVDEKGSNAEPNIVSIRREIKIEDRNDNPPVFTSDFYTVSVNETASINTQFFNKILVTDIDSGNNAEIKLTCLEEVLILINTY